MIHCSGDSLDLIRFDGIKSIITVPGDSREHHIWHSMQYMDYKTDVFVAEFGKVSPSVKWELRAVPYNNNQRPVTLLTGTGGGTYRVPLSKMGLPRWEGADLHVCLKADQEGSVEILRLAVETPHPDPAAKQKAKASKALVNVLPLERGMIPHWNPKMGGFVCAYNQMHQEHYNYWLEDEGELLWGLGNYPEMMKLYGKGLRDFIVEYSKAGAPVRKVVDKPLTANSFQKPGHYWMDTGTLTITGELQEDPYVHLHPSVYESGGLLMAFGDFYVSYRMPDGSVHTLKFDHPSKYSIDYDVPKVNMARLRIEAANEQVAGRIDFIVSGSRVTENLELTNLTSATLVDLTSGFRVRDVDRYYKSGINKIKTFPRVALIYSDQPALENSNIIRIAGPLAAKQTVQKEGNVIRQIDVAGQLTGQIATGRTFRAKLAAINAGSTCFVDKVEIYKDVNFADAEISMSYVGTYPLLGLATYSYRYPEDKEAREVTNRMIDNFYAARHRLRDRELGYLLWVLNLMGRDKEATVIADQIEEYVRPGQTFDNSQNSSAMAIGLRSVGRWEVADRICAHTITQYGGVNAPTDFLGFGCGQAPAVNKDCYKQLSDTLRQMYWDSADRLTAHSARTVEEGPEEVQAYALVSFDFISRYYGGIVPIRLDTSKGTQITNMSFDPKSGDWKAQVVKAGEVDVFTGFRAPRKVQWNGQDLHRFMTPAEAGLASLNDSANPKAPGWIYDGLTGTVRFKGLTGDGEITIAVDGDPVRPKSDWQPIDYIGYDKRPK